MRVAISLFLLFSQFHYKAQRSSHEPWVPTQKLPRLLTTSASAIRKIQRLGEIHDLDVDRQVRLSFCAHSLDTAISGLIGTLAFL